jgi:hypothetical protein
MVVVLPGLSVEGLPLVLAAVEVVAAVEMKMM